MCYYYYYFNDYFAVAERNPSPSAFGNASERSTLRWRKDTALWRSTSEVGDKPRVDVELDAYIEGNLSTQTSLIILDTLEVIVQVMIAQKHVSCRLIRWLLISVINRCERWFHSTTTCTFSCPSRCGCYSTCSAAARVLPSSKMLSLPNELSSSRYSIIFTILNVLKTFLLKYKSY